MAGADNYIIIRDGLGIAVEAGTATRFIDYAMPGAGAYNYCIEAVDESGESAAACDGASLPASAVTVNAADWYNDVFPSDNNPALPGTAAFDRTTAVLKTGRNLAACGVGFGRAVMAGNQMFVNAAGAVARVDLVFRIKPGPGNYAVVCATGSGLLVSPAAPFGPVSVPGDGSFWGTYMAAPGLFASPGAAALHAAGPSGWDPNVWNSAQCTLAAPGVYSSNQFAAPALSILPNALYTPGSHLEYFFRVLFADASVTLIPDTNCVMQVRGERSLDGHRWEAFSVLPDRWKDPACGGLGDACMLVVDLDDQHGDERAWVSVADSIGMTAPAAYGAGTGWHGIGRLGPADANPVDIDLPANNRRPDGSVGFISAHRGAPGTTWDLYTVRGEDSNCDGNAGALGGRLGVVPGGETPPGPTPAMLAAYYKIILLLSGNRNSMILGPIFDRSQDDITQLQNFLLGSTLGDPRAVMVLGNGFAESESAAPPAHVAFLATFLGVSLRDPDYATLSGLDRPCADLIPASPISSTEIGGVRNFAPTTNDVLNVNAAMPEALAVGFYQDFGAGAPYVASVLKPAVAARPWTTLLGGWNLEQMGDRFCSGRSGMRQYVLDVTDNVLAPICPLTSGSPIAVDPPGDGALRSGGLLMVSNNPLAAGAARIEFRVPAAGAVELVAYDAAGRPVRRLARGRFDAGTHPLAWDGTDDAGHRLPRGVYWIRFRLEGGTEQEARGLVLLK